MHELPLVFFTVFGQSAVGLLLLTLISDRCGLTEQPLLKRASLLAFGLMGIGLLIGTLHVGQPLRAMNMLSGLGRSPMSNEILLSGAFFGLLCCTVFFTSVKKNTGLANIFNGVTILVGLAFAWSITQVYQLETVDNWNTVHTSLQMWLTVLIGGGACAVLVGARRAGGVLLLIGGIISLIAKPDYLGLVNQISPQLASAQNLFWSVQIFCLSLAVLIGAIALIKKQSCGSILFCGAVAVVIGELAGRIAFYNLWAVAM
ncbi:dimethyl sulfoxide reductase anchor subunit family protein [Budvicia aquatica]|uniref:DMSO reductase anchor subunit n=1 Tax=Budvicia aquatica TaxID=82979 RepID=A0A2C6DKC6_9GAMM|nr:DmsC/YnfH family molybdoenzyme membrane anchor subunit [Budvicia aquatica]PHI29214.1 diguanylate cyclase [Budvicia aquatica]VFS47422.1 DMSO reductase anchor subunit [Budvicia aquatica]